jgi:YidC/Oxa1 family membrane protein insertase
MGETPAAAFAAGIATAIPYLVMMILMVATQYVQTWHSTYGQDKPQGPQAGAQQAVTKIMPLFIGFISWNFPAGLVLYWATANLFRLGQQVVIFKIDGRPTTVAAAAIADTPPADEEATPKKPQPGSAKKQRRRRRS